MLTQKFHHNDKLLGISVVKNGDKLFTFYVAFINKNIIKIKYINSISGDLENEKLFERVIEEGNELSAEIGIKIFPDLTSIAIDE